MIKTLDIFSSSKTDEIMSRYRPIAPKPLILQQNPLLHPQPNDNGQQSPSLRRPKKRSRARIPSSSAHKKAKTHVTNFSSGAAPPPPPPPLAKKTQLGHSLHGFGPGFSGFPFPSPGLHENPADSKDLVTLPLMPYPCPVSALMRKEPASNDPEDKVGLSLFPSNQSRALDLNCKPEIPEEKDLLQRMQASLPGGSKNPGSSTVIMPQPVRPVGSSISVGCINENTGSYPAAPVCKKAEEVEEEVESEALPSVISDSKNKVRLANSAYKELVGQPECPWLESMVTKDGRKGTTAPERISGEVVLDLSEASVPVSSNGFSCKVKIEWASNGQKIFIIAPCNVMRLSCQAKDYMFTWRFLIPNSIA
ncbi:hypothetical protein CKAN_00646000 [Cinnamomum micranthum f. kanehirae]|uniref:DUF7950 domain-containing protein n=1 Tax=Cinnamomum micranthum f. kanehirae TaxID=337451 RepID=A0A443NHG1_9MAGN|nr:hypothetical protein CKAN_00646000 [Cinnamomum micranthum f. kanehirae]